MCMDGRTSHGCLPMQHGSEPARQIRLTGEVGGRLEADERDVVFSLHRPVVLAVSDDALRLDVHWWVVTHCGVGRVGELRL